MSPSKSCSGAGEHQGRPQGGARWTARGHCSVCGKTLALTSSGRIPRHAAPPAAEDHVVRWYGRTGAGRPFVPGIPEDDDPVDWIPRTKRMPASAWGWDARCSCGWETKTGGAIAARIKDAVFWHRWDVEHGFAQDSDPYVPV